MLWRHLSHGRVVGPGQCAPHLPVPCCHRVLLPPFSFLFTCLPNSPSLAVTANKKPSCMHTCVSSAFFGAQHVPVFMGPIQRTKLRTQTHSVSIMPHSNRLWPCVASRALQCEISDLEVKRTFAPMPLPSPAQR